ncbi:MAG: M56 family metallopeptidase [Robiginitalea sp.]|uniref:M56 family metallopeptidase n=1 Tax=Robiginitalea sp. TaxID=1902411 RepID=UPI003C72B352
MEVYILKASAILALFLFVYQLFLKNETFFTLNRFFLLGGLLAALLLPFVTLQDEVLIQARTLNAAPALNGVPVSDSTPFDWRNVLPWAYLPGILICTGMVFRQLLGLFTMIRKEEKRTHEGYVLIPSTYIKGPFSFFRYIFYNPQLHDQDELQLILEHEKAHGKQLHSLDILLARVTAIILWINPMVWWYQKIIQQNLEYLADAQAVSDLSSIREYQYALLKVSGNQTTPPLVSHFNQSLIKKRIVMLQRHQSKSIHVLKYLLILPMLALFLMAFNRETVYVMEESPASMVFSPQAKSIEYLIDKNTTDAQLLKMKNDLAKDDIDFSYTTVRNAAKEIIDISINVIGTSKNGNSFTGSYNSDSEEPIKPMMVRITTEGGISIGEVSALQEIEEGSEIHFSSGSGDHNVWVYDSEGDDAKTIEIREVNGERVFVVDGKTVTREELHEIGDEKKVTVRVMRTDGDSEDGTFIIREDIKGVDSDGSSYIIMENMEGDDTEKVIRWNAKGSSGASYSTVIINDDDFKHGDHTRVIVTDGKKPLILIDGKKANEKAMKELDPDQIETINVIKGDKAIEKHGKKAKNGVVEITTKKG